MHIELDAWGQNSKLRPKASLHKGGGLLAASHKGGGPLRGPPPLWESFMEAGFRPVFRICAPKHLIYMHLIVGCKSQEIRCLDLDAC